MAIKIALAGNPNSGKTTMFNDLTGSNQYVGNWPGVTVEKKEGKLRENRDVTIQDLPGIYSLSPYTLEEVVARGYLVGERPDAILNIVDASNIERNLYLTTQLSELGIPMVVALNMMDIVRKNGDVIDIEKLSKALGCPVMETSALKGQGSEAAALKAASVVGAPVREVPSIFAGPVEHALAHIEDLITHNDENGLHHHHADGVVHTGGIVDARLSRWYSIKLFERDAKVLEELNLPQRTRDAIEKVVAACEQDMDDDAESIITNQRYEHVSRIVSRCVKKGRPAGALSTSDKIDRIMTNRVLALPIFAAIMFFVYYIAVSSVGALLTDFTNDTFVSEWIQTPVVEWLRSIGTADWLVGVIGDGIIGGVGAVLGFVPQLLVLFFMLSILEDVGYMSRIAFIMDRLLRKFGLSGKSFIPMLISTGCGVPGIMASRTIEQDKDRKMTIMTTTFIPCGAKLPIIAMIAGAMFGNAGWVATVCYFAGIAAVVLSGVMLKKTKAFAGDPSPFVMELPAYHFPSWKNVLHSMWERGSDFIKRAGTVILVSSILIWFASTYGWAPVENSADPATGNAAQQDVEYKWGAVEEDDQSILGHIGSVVAPIFEPLGFGDWKPTVATVMGLVAKEEVVGVFGVLYDAEDAVEEGSAEALSPIAKGFDEMSNGYGRLAAFSFMLFNLLCAPCFAAMGAIKREMNNGRWTAFALGYQCVFAYAVSLMIFQFGRLFNGAGFGIGSAVAVIILAFMVYMLFRRNKYAAGKL